MRSLFDLNSLPKCIVYLATYSIDLCVYMYIYTARGDSLQEKFHIHSIQTISMFEMCVYKYYRKAYHLGMQSKYVVGIFTSPGRFAMYM